MPGRNVFLNSKHKWKTTFGNFSSAQCINVRDNRGELEKTLTISQRKASCLKVIYVHVQQQQNWSHKT